MTEAGTSRATEQAKRDANIASTSAGSDDELESFIPKRRWWPFVLIAAALFAGGAIGAVLLQRQLHPSRVLIAVNLDGYWWEGSEASATVTDRFAERLAALGFEPVKAGDPQVMAILEQAESPRAAADDLGAAFVISADLKPELIQHEITPTYYEGRVAGDLFLSYADEAPSLAGHVDGWSGSLDPSKTKALLGKTMADKVFDLGMLALMEHRAVREILSEGSAVDRGMLSRATRFLDIRNEALKHAHDRYAELLEKRLKAEEGGHGQKYRGKLDEDVALGAVTPKGFLSQSTKIHPFYDPATESLRYYRDLDSLYWTNEKGERQELTRAYNLYGYPAASRDGETVVLVEDIFGWAKAISVSRGGQPPKRLRVDPDHRYSTGAVSPGGRYAAYYDRPCRKCLNGILAIELAEGKTLFEHQQDKGEPSGFVWLDENRLLILWRPVPTEEQEGLVHQGIYVVDVSAPKPELELLLELDESTTLRGGSADHKGQHIAFTRSHEDGRHLAIFNVETKELSTHDVAGGLNFPVLSPDGNAVVFEQGGEVVHWVLASGKRTQLTNNTVRDRYPMFTPDGSKVFYESLGDDPNFPKERNVSVVVSVEAP